MRVSNIERLVLGNIKRTILIGAIALGVGYAANAYAQQPSISPVNVAPIVTDGVAPSQLPLSESAQPTGFTFLPFRKSASFRVTSYFDEDPRNDIQRKYDGTTGGVDSRGYVVDLLDNHFGIDFLLNNPPGTIVDVIAIQDGSALLDPERPDYLQIGPGSNNVFIGYARMSRITVPNGSLVSKGQKIGEKISNPNAGSKLHIEAIVGYGGGYFYWDFFRDVTGKSSIGGTPVHTASLWARGDNCPEFYEDLGKPELACRGAVYVPGQSMHLYFLPAMFKRGR